MVRHGDDHVHIVVSRVNDLGGVRHARQDYRAAQSAAPALDKHLGLELAPRQKTPGQARTSRTSVQEQHQDAAQQFTTQRT